MGLSVIADRTVAAGRQGEGPRIGFLGTVANPLRSVVAPELHIDLPAGVELRGYPSRVAAFPRRPVERSLQDIGHLDAGLRAAADGCDALVIDSVGDYGLAALRDGLAVPTIGPGEAGMATAHANGRPFAIVTVWPEAMNFIPRDLLRAYGYADACRAIRNVGTDEDVASAARPDGYLERVHRAETTILAAVVRAAEACVADGAEVVMLGCTCMSPMAGRMAAGVPFPIVNPLREAAIRAVELAGSRQAGPAIRTERAHVVHRMVDAIAGDEPEECPVCIVSSRD